MDRGLSANSGRCLRMGLRVHSQCGAWPPAQLTTKSYITTDTHRCRAMAIVSNRSGWSLAHLHWSQCLNRANQAIFSDNQGRRRANFQHVNYIRW